MKFVHFKPIQMIDNISFSLKNDNFNSNTIFISLTELTLFQLRSTQITHNKFGEKKNHQMPLAAESLHTNSEN